MNDIAYDEQSIVNMFYSLDLKQLEYIYNVLNLLIDKRVVEGDLE